MNLRSIFFVSLAVVALPMAAQETYQDTKLIDNELNGTARYVGMGGAMEALGADLSTISSNPAGLGLYRKSQVALSGGLVSQSGVDNHLYYGGTEIKIDGNKTNMSFDQIGLVWANRTGEKSFLNLGFNYHKSRNFDQLMLAAGPLGGLSQSHLSALKYRYAQKYPDAADGIWNGVDDNYAKVLGLAPNKSMIYMANATQYLFGQYQKGYIGEYDFNISGNIKDRFYLGLTFGLHDVHYRSNSFYTEDFAAGDVITQTWESLRVSGTGFDIKAGAIFRPIVDSPFRIGLYMSTPIFYDLDIDGDASLSIRNPHQPNGTAKNKDNSVSYEYRVNTPWKFGLSLGHTIGNYLALGATYEYSDYRHIDNRAKTSGYDSWDGSIYESSESETYTNNHTKHTLRGVSTLKLGVEAKPTPALSLRVGYNYVSPLFEEKGFRDGTVYGLGSRMSTSTDYTNWKSTNRVTLGVGYLIQAFSVDLAYQYSQTDGDFYPFGNEYLAKGFNETVTPAAVKVSNKRNQLLLTLGYRF